MERKPECTKQALISSLGQGEPAVRVSTHKVAARAWLSG